MTKTENKTMENSTDITDSVRDVVLAVKSGEKFVDCAHLTDAECIAVNKALGFRFLLVLGE